MLHRIVKKAGPDLHIFLNSVVLMLCVILIAMVGYLLFKHMALKSAVFNFVYQGELATKLRYLGAAGVEDAQILATTVGQVPSDKPLFTNQKELQGYVTKLSHQTGRDIVVMDTHQVILADSIPQNVGKYYTYANGEDILAMKGGNPRRFSEKSNDYPGEVDELVVPVKSSTGVTIGAVIMSTSHVFDD